MSPGVNELFKIGWRAWYLLGEHFTILCLLKFVDYMHPGFVHLCGGSANQWLHGGESTKYFAFAHFSCSKYFAYFTYFNFVYIYARYILFSPLEGKCWPMSAEARARKIEEKPYEKWDRHQMVCFPPLSCCSTCWLQHNNLQESMITSQATLSLAGSRQIGPLAYFANTYFPNCKQNISNNKISSYCPMHNVHFG